MTGQQLKNSILQLAIQGKLVPQDPNDEPASVLLEKIRKEKEQLVKDKKLKKKDLVTTPVSDEEKPFEIPDGWEWVRWGVLSFNIQYGYNAPALSSGDIRMVRISDIQNGEVQWGTVPYCNIEKNEISSYQLGENDILFARTGGTVGKSFLVKEVPYPSIFAGYLIRTQYDSNLLVPRFLKMFMESDMYWRQLKDGTIATAQPNCNGKTLSNMVLPLPPLAEQHRIVARIEELMPLVEKYGKAQEELEKLNVDLPDHLRKSVLQEAIQGRLVPQDPNDEPASVLLEKIRKEKEQLVKDGKLKKKDLVTTPVSDEEKPFEIPDGWEWVTLGQIASIYGGKRIPAGRKLTDVNTGHIYIRVADMKNNSVNIDGLKYITDDIYETIKRYIINKNDLYITVAGTIGCVGTIPEILDGANLTENANKIVFKLLNKKYLLYLLNSPFVQKQIKDCTTKVGQPKLAIIRIQGFKVPLPPLAEQHRIVAKLEEILVKIDNL